MRTAKQEGRACGRVRDGEELGRVINKIREWGPGNREWNKFEMGMARVRPAAELDKLPL